MRRFVFRLQRVMEIRQQAVDEAVAYLENCKTVLSELRRLLMEQRDAYIAERELLNQSVLNGEAYQYNVYEQSLETRKRRMMELLEAIRVAESDVDIAEQHLVTCNRNLKVMENLRSKQEREFQIAEEQKERKFLDEQATFRFHRSTYDSSRE